MTGVHVLIDYFTAKKDETSSGDDVGGSSCKKLKSRQGPANQNDKETDETCTFYMDFLGSFAEPP